MAAYNRPGNLRQLSACLRTLVALSEPGAMIGVELLPSHLHELRPCMATPLAAGAVHGTGLEAMGQAAMRQALGDCNGNISHAARKLGVSRSTLYRRLGEELPGRGQ